MFITALRSDSGDRSPAGNFWFESVGARAGAVRVTPSSALGLPAVWACVNILAKSFALMPFYLYEQLEPRGRKARKDHWLYRLIAKAPNQYQTPFEWRLMLMGHLALRGNAFCQIMANSRGEILELLPLHPDRMQMDVLPSGNYRYLYRKESGEQVVYTRGEIWHLRGLSSDGYVGMSPIEMAREAIGEGLAMQSYASRFFANDARPAGWVEYDGKFSDADARKKWRESWQETYSAKNGRKVAVLEKGMKYHELTLSNTDSQFVESRSDNLANIARVFGVQPHKIADLGRSTNNNIEHQSIEFWTDTMLPWAECWESSIEFNLLGPDITPELEPEFDMSRMMRGDGKARADRIRGLVSGGVLTPNEGREEEGYDSLAGGDVLFRPLNMETVDENGDVQRSPDATVAAPPTVPGDPRPDARMLALLTGNATRMARRMASGNAPSLEVLADALAIETDAAAEWLQHTRSLVAMAQMSEQELAEALVSLALGNKPNPLTVGAAAMRQLSGAIAAMPSPVVHNTVNVEPAAVTVQPAEVHAHVDVAAPNVMVEKTEVHNHVPEQRVSVNVEAPNVEIHNAIPVAAAPIVHNHVETQKPQVTVIQSEPKKPGQQDRPWPTKTVITKRDSQGRADVIETSPIDD